MYKTHTTHTTINFPDSNYIKVKGQDLRKSAVELLEKLESILKRTIEESAQNLIKLNQLNLDFADWLLSGEAVDLYLTRVRNDMSKDGKDKPVVKWGFINKGFEEFDLRWTFHSFFDDLPKKFQESRFAYGASIPRQMDTIVKFDSFGREDAKRILKEYADNITIRDADTCLDIEVVKTYSSVLAEGSFVRDCIKEASKFAKVEEEEVFMNMNDYVRVYKHGMIVAKDGE